MKTIILVGDQANASKLLAEVNKSAPIHLHTCFINGQSVRMYYEPQTAKVVKKNSGAIIVVTGNDNKTPKDIEKYHPYMPSDFTFIYTQNKTETPFEFVQHIVNHSHVKNDKPTMAQKFMLTLFGNKEETTNKTKRHLSMRF